MVNDIRDACCRLLGPRFDPRTRALSISALALLVATCGGANRTPADLSPSTRSLSSTITGRVTEALSDTPLPGVNVAIAGIGTTTSAADGLFSASTSEPQFLYRVTLRSPSTVERATGVKVGAAATLSLIPASFDMAAFDQIARGNGGALRRWIAPPRLVVQRRVLVFTSLSAVSYVATARLMSDQDVASLVADLSDALPVVSGGAHAAFADVIIQTAAEGDVVEVSSQNTIHVARYEGLEAETKFAGYTRWSWNAFGELTRAIIVLDRRYDEAGSSFRRALRTHEFGHAYGYNHATGRLSFMNETATIEPNANDRDIARLAFQRPPLNVSPDSDPQAFSTNRAPATETWTGSH